MIIYLLLVVKSTGSRERRINIIKSLINTLKDWYTLETQRYHEEQAKKAFEARQILYKQYKDYLNVVSLHFARFFRQHLHQINTFNPASLDCTVVRLTPDSCYLFLQIPLHNQPEVPNNTLEQMIENLLRATCFDYQQKLKARANQILALDATPSMLIQYYNLVDNSLFYFMNYRLKMVSVDSFKVCLAVKCTLNLPLMNSYYIW